MNLPNSTVELHGARILVVDDIAENRKLLCDTLEPEGYRISSAPNGEVALKVAQASPPDLILLDIMMPGLDGFEVCRRLKASQLTRSIPVIFITAATDSASVVEGFRVGGIDYISKPFQAAEVLSRSRTHLQNSLLTQLVTEQNRQLQAANEELRAEIGRRQQAEHARQISDDQLSLISDRETERWGIPAFIGKSQTFRKILEDIRRLQNFDRASVLITGESGTGKELIARAIHFGSSHAKGPFIPVNCSAIPRELAESLLFGHARGSFTGAQTEHKGYFELAHQGTLFLDEVGELPLELQPKLLRVLEDGRVTPLGGSEERAVRVRLVAASNVDFTARMQEGKFRSDLYFRLARFTVDAPPLRDRREDIPLLIQHFLNLYAVEMSLPKPDISTEAFRALMDYPFPGNVRELKNILERAVIESGGGSVAPEHLHFFYAPDRAAGTTNRLRTGPAGSTLSDEERILAHTSTRGSINNTECRDLLRVDRNRASYLLKKLHGSGQLACDGQGRWATYRLPGRALPSPVEQ